MTKRYCLAISGQQTMYVQYCFAYDLALEMHLTNDVLHAAVYETEDMALTEKNKLPISDMVEVVPEDIIYN